MTSDVHDYFEINTGFELFDIFRRRRLQKTLDAYDELRFYKNQEILEREKTIKRQAVLIRNADKEIQTLQQQASIKDTIIDELTDSLDKEKAKNLYAESSKTSSTKALKELSNQNTELRIALNNAKADFEELSDMHDRLIALIRKEHPDILLDEIYSTRKVG